MPTRLRTTATFALIAWIGGSSIADAAEGPPSTPVAEVASAPARESAEMARMRKKAKERGLDDTKWFNNVEWIVAESVGPITVNYVRNIFQYFIIYSAVYDRHLQLEDIKKQ